MSTWAPQQPPAQQPWQGPYKPPGDKCDLHPGTKWTGDVPCFVCYPTLEAEGTHEYPESIVPDPAAYIRPAVNRCAVLRDPESDNAVCGRPGSDHTVLGFAICTECYEAIRQP